MNNQKIYLSSIERLVSRWYQASTNYMLKFGSVLQNFKYDKIEVNQCFFCIVASVRTIMTASKKLLYCEMYLTVMRGRRYWAQQRSSSIVSVEEKLCCPLYTRTLGLSFRFPVFFVFFPGTKKNEKSLFSIDLTVSKLLLINNLVDLRKSFKRPPD